MQQLLLRRSRYQIMGTSSDDLTVLKELRSGNRSRWNEVYSELWDTGMKVACVKLQGERHRLDREDIVHQAMLELHRGFFSENSRNQFESLRDLTGMMLTITHRRLLDFHRKKFRRGEVGYGDPDSIDSIEEPAAEDSSGDDGIWDLVPEGLDDPGRLWELVGRLEKPKPELLYDRFKLGLSASEAGAKHGILRSTVLSHWHLSMKILRRWLSGSND
jgi:DNA-directed RNA polymerase specialized sigma24 family protein